MAVLILASWWVACDSGNPVAPQAPTDGGGGGGGGQGFTITLAGDPTSLEAGSTDFSRITVTVLQTSDQQPPADGTTLAVNTNLGNFGNDAQGNALQLVNVELLGGAATVDLFAGADVGTATVLAQVGGSVGQMSISVVELTLAITALVPASGVPAGGDQVMIQGQGFRQPLQVRFGSVAATVVEVSSETAMVVETPPSVTPVAAGETLAVDVFVTTALDRPSPRTATLAGGFTYSPEAPPPLFLLGVSPATGNASGGDRVRVSGGGFLAPLQVVFGDRVGIDPEVVSEHTIRVTTPGSADPTSVVTVDVKVINAINQAEPPEVTLSGAFTYASETVPALFITEIDPTSGTVDGGTKVTLDGAGFVAPVRVEFGGIAGTAADVVSANKVTVRSPPAVDPTVASVVDVVLINDLNDAEPRSTSVPGAFRYVPDVVDTLAIQQLDPNSGDGDGGETVRVLGSGFVEQVRVDFGGIAGVSPQFVNSGELTVEVPVPVPALSAGELRAVDIVVTIFPPAGEQSATLAGGYTYQADPPADPVVVSAVIPSQGTYRGGETVTVMGQGFVSPVAVELGGIRQTGEAFVDSTELTFVTAGIAVGSCPDDGRLPQQGIKVTNVDSGDSGTGDLTFSYTVELPRVDRTSPNSGAQAGGQSILVIGDDFFSPVRVSFVAGDQEAAGRVVSSTETQVQVVTPAFDDTFLAQTTCVIDSDTTGFRLVATSVGVRVVNQDTGCVDTLPNAFTLQPTDTSCQGG